MFKTFFKGLAEKENGDFYFKDKDVSLGLGVRSPNVTYVVKFEYKGCEFSVMNSTGRSYEGNITCKLPSSFQIIPFEITNISHLKNLFLRKKNRLKIQSVNKNIAYFLEKSKDLKDLNVLALKDNYSPWIVSDVELRTIVCKYHLEFNDWTDVVEPTIALYKSLIDEFEKGVAHLNYSQYRDAINLV